MLKIIASVIFYASDVTNVTMIVFYVVYSSVGNQLTLIKAFRRVFRLANEWYTLGLLLNVPKSSLSTIRTNIQGDHDRPFKSNLSIFRRDNTYDLECLHETLQEWLNQTDSPPTWHELAEVVEPFDRSKAQEIRQHYCVGEERYEDGMNHCV